MDRYLFENNQIIFYKYKAISDDETYYFVSKDALDKFIKTNKVTDYQEIELSNLAKLFDGLKCESNAIIQIIFKCSKYSKQICINKLQELLNSDSWEFGRWKLDKIQEYTLTGLECPYSSEEIKKLHYIREFIRSLIREYQNK